jgi:hypothetical protein
MTEKQAVEERRRKNRLAIKVPVRVRGREMGGTAWEEVAASLDASEGGLAIVMAHPVRTGQVLHLSVPLPSRYRQYDLTSSSYRIYGLVRSSCSLEARSRVGVMFLGPQPPRGSDTLPAGLFQLPGDRPEAARTTASLLLRLEADEAPGGIAQEEHASVERLTASSAVVRVRSLPVGRGSIVSVEDPDGGFRTRAEVSVISIEELGHARLVLRVLDAPIPDRLLSDSAIGN